MIRLIDISLLNQLIKLVIEIFLMKSKIKLDNVLKNLKMLSSLMKNMQQI